MGFTDDVDLDWLTVRKLDFTSVPLLLKVLV